MKEKYHIEYIFDTVSRRSLWNHLATPHGLSSWFADEVYIRSNMYVFKWNKEEQAAEIVSMRPELKVRYRWVGDDKAVYFGFSIHTIELTGGISLEITDFAEHDEKHESIELWNTQVEALKRTLGI
ncbi:hypothetical protein FACS1894181_16540 [Bacteroidia bacterium]|nr:hypothetical protein FACS1894181_16540 [Bacteroidia bacterium]